MHTKIVISKYIWKDIGQVSKLLWQEHVKIYFLLFWVVVSRNASAISHKLYPTHVPRTCLKKKNNKQTNKQKKKNMSNQFMLQLLFQ